MRLEQLTGLLDDAEVEYQISNGVAVVELPGEHRLKTNTLLIPQDGGLRVEAFVCRAVEENHAEVYRMLLQHNRKVFGVHYTLDNNSDIYLVGQLTDSVTPDEIQSLLGQTLELADGDFNRILERGFEGSIRREWAWRLARGESTRNLEAFDRLRPGFEEEKRRERDEERRGTAVAPGQGRVPPAPGVGRGPR